MADICRFYLQGSCRYGDQCRYRHVRDRNQQSYNDYNYNQRQNYNNSYGHSDDHYSGNAYENRSRSNYNRASDISFTSDHGRNAQHNRFGDQPRTSPFGYQKEQNKDRADLRDTPTSDITATVMSEIKDWLPSGMWLHSCYSCYKYLPNIPMFDDFSQEEMRLKAYECKLANKFVEYDNWVHKLTSDKSELLAQFQYKSSNINKQLADYINSVKTIEINNDGSGTMISANTFNFTAFSANNAASTSWPGTQAAVTAWPSTQPATSFPTNTDSKPAGVFSFTEGKYVTNDSVKSSAPKLAAGLQGSVYSDISKLTLADRKEFEANQFSLGKIPLCPPPRELV